MQLLPLPAHVPVLIWDDFYTQEELNLLWREFNFLTDSNKFKPPKETGAAREGKKHKPAVLHFGRY
jgi:hypothetical protein